MAELARPDAVGVLGEAQPGDRERGPKRPVLLVLVSFRHTQAVFGVIAIVFTHRLVLPSARNYDNDQRLQGCYAVNGTIVDILLDTPRARTRRKHGQIAAGQGDEVIKDL